MSDEKLVLNAIQSFPFEVGKNLLITHLQGGQNETLTRHGFDKLPSYATMAYTTGELETLIKKMFKKGLLTRKPIKNGKYKVITTTKKAQTYKAKKTKKYENTSLKQKEKILFQNLPFLKNFNKYQKRSITTNQKKVLVVAGPGTGKTTVLTKRIEFLTNYKSVKPTRILAITFTRKAKNELKKRLAKNNIHQTNIHTFHSFAEKFGDKTKKVMDYKEKIHATSQALDQQGLRFEDAIDKYYTHQELKRQNPKTLTNKFIKTMFHYINSLKIQGLTPQTIPGMSEKEHLVKNTIQNIHEYIQENNKKTHADQLIQVQKKLIHKKYEHVLVDEYQDVNEKQEDILTMIQPDNLFLVGDPRQSIYAWRGGSEDLIHQKLEQDTYQKIFLTKNYRSKKEIVDLYNALMQDEKLPGIQATKTSGAITKITKFDTQQQEKRYVANQCKNDEDTLILCRTNKQLRDLSDYLKTKRIRHGVKNEYFETRHKTPIKIATVHAAKGLEAKKVIIYNCDNTSFPCSKKTTELDELLTFTAYDEWEEEKKLFYVALSRAEETLLLTYTTIMSDFINPTMKNKLEDKGEYKPKTYEQLKQWNKKNKINKPNSVLLDIAKKKPNNVYDLKNIPGLTPNDVYQHGQEIINIIQK